MLDRLDQLLNTHKKILFAGVGNVLRQDDAVGVYICERIKQNGHIQSLVVGQSIENYIGKIQQINPDILVVIDCVDFNKPPGEAFLILLDDLLDYTSNTHNISFKTLSRFFDMPVQILGIQPQNVDYGEGMSLRIQEAAEKMIDIINSMWEFETCGFNEEL
ncbi:MAG TPA: hydrogenase maturation protease [Balneolales bacterium]|nr:hydrogenase maturation protease [Balneolales bacterium]